MYLHNHAPRIASRADIAHVQYPGWTLRQNILARGRCPTKPKGFHADSGPTLRDKDHTPSYAIVSVWSIHSLSRLIIWPQDLPLRHHPLLFCPPLRLLCLFLHLLAPLLRLLCPFHDLAQVYHPYRLLGFG
eukprot:COSAG02_NODE_3191_length_7197_cov_28.589321_3_plen_131_part_00